MITVIDEKGNVAFINESECVSIVYRKEDRVVVASPIQRTADIGLPLQDMRFENVVCVTYNNEAHPTSQIFQEEKPAPPPTEYEELPVRALYDEINRLDEIDKKQKAKEWRERFPNSRHRVQKSGRAIRFLNVCRQEDIETIGQIVKMGRVNFESVRNMGRDCADKVAEALENLYGIKW